MAEKNFDEPSFIVRHPNKPCDDDSADDSDTSEDNEDLGHQVYRENSENVHQPHLNQNENTDSEPEKQHSQIHPKMLCDDDSTDDSDTSSLSDDNEDIGNKVYTEHHAQNRNTALEPKAAAQPKHSGHSAQIPIRSLDDDGEYERIEVFFCLYCEPVKKVMLIIKDSENRTTKLRMKSCTRGLYSASTSLPLHLCRNGINYCYERRSLPMFIGRVFRNDNTKTEKERNFRSLKDISKGIPIRDYWDVMDVLDKIPRTGFRAHCLHIFREFSNDRISEVIHDIDSMMGKLIYHSQDTCTLNDGEIKDLVKTITDISREKHKSIFIALLILLSYAGFNQVQLLHKNQAIKIIENVCDSGQDVTCMSKMYQEKIPKLLYDVCEVAYESEMTILLLIEKTFPFLDAKEYMSLVDLQDGHTRRCFTRHSMDDVTADVARIVKKLTGKKPLKAKRWTLLETIIKLLEFKDLQKLRRSIPENELIKEIFKTRCRRQIRNARNLQELYEICKFVDQPVDTKLNDIVYKKLLEFLRNDDNEFLPSVSDKSKAMSFFCHIFFENCVPNRMIDLLVRFPENREHYLFQLLNHPVVATEEVYCKTAIGKLMEKKLSFLKENISITGKVYSWIADINQLPAFKEENCISIENKVLKTMEIFSFWDLFTVALLQNSRNSLFEEHIGQLLKTKRPIEVEMEEIHKRISCRVTTKFDGNQLSITRFCASLLELLLHMMKPHFDSMGTDSVQVVQLVLDDALFWKSIIRSSSEIMDKVRRHQVYVKARSSFRCLKEELIYNRFKYSFVLKHDTATTDILVQLTKYFTTQSTDGLRTEIEQACERMIYTRKNLQDTLEMLQDLENMLPEDYLAYFSQGLARITLSVNQQLSSLESNQQNLRTCFASGIPDCCKNIKTYYSHVSPVLASDIFWKINEIEKDQLLHRTTQEDIFLAIENFLKMLANNFLRRYKLYWENDLCCPSLLLKDIKGLTNGRNVNKEIAIILKYVPSASKIETSLRNFFKFEENSKKLSLLFSTATILVDKSFLPKIRYTAIMDVQHELQQVINAEDGILEDIDSDLQRIADFASEITDDMQEVLELMQISTELLHFLQEISVDDIHNMADSLEEYSEDIVRKSTVISLMEVEKVFRILLQKNRKTDQNADMMLFTILRTQSQDLKEFTRRLDECIANTFSLTDLHRKHENKDNRTEDMINNILCYGTLHFEFIDLKYHLRLRMEDYSKTPLKKSKTKHLPSVACYLFDESELADLQSRARLIFNTIKKERNVGGNLEKFVDIVETGFEVVEILMALKDIGHYKYVTYGNQQKCNGNEIKKLLDSLKTDYLSWKNDVRIVRDKYHCLNFVHSAQLADLYEYFVLGITNWDAKSILLFVKPTNSVLPKVRTIKSLHFSSVDILVHISKQIQRMEKCTPIDNIHLPTRQKSSSNLNTQWTKSRILISRLKENSNQGFNVMFAMYMERSEVFPKANQVIVCTPETTWLDLKLLLRRCWCQSKTSDELYCIVHGDLLCDKTLQKLSKHIKKGSKGTNNTLAIIFRGNEANAFLERHQDSIHKVHPLSIAEMKKCIENTWSSVSLVTSSFAGLGKTEYIRKEVRRNSTLKHTQILHVSSVLNKTSVIKRLQKLKISKTTLLHIDLGMIDHPEDLDQFLFELIILRYVRSGYHSVFLRTQFIAIEVANTINNALLEKLTLLSYFKTVYLRWEGYDNLIVSQEITSPMQIVCRYLYALQKNRIDKTDISFSNNNTSVLRPLTKELCQRILSINFQIDTGMSYTRIHIFLAVFSSQLRKLSESDFFQSKRIASILEADSHSIPTVRSSMVKMMLEISREFSCRHVESSIHPSCNINDEAADFDALDSKCKNEIYEKEDKNEKLSQNIIRWEDINHVFVMFHQDGQTLSLLYKELRCEREYVKVVKDFITNQVHSNDISLKGMGQSVLKDILRMIACKAEIPEEDYEIALENYVLTPDNVMKFFLILLRVRANIPVVLLGDTGCGKTSLIKVLAKICDVRFEMLTIHAGITEEQIVESILKINDDANGNSSKDFWFFIDEINTNENVGLLSDVLCHHVCLEHVLAPNLSIMAACNPYRFQRAKSKRTNVGLCRSFSKSNKMSHLVYHVHPLPESLLTLVWDFGTLGKDDEIEYIEEMLKVCNMDAIELKVFTMAVVESHEFVRTIDHNEYSVSLRDVERARDLWKWFTETYFVRKYGYSEGKNKEAIILTLNLCYRIRFQSNTDRKSYIEKIKSISDFYRSFETVVQTEQDDVVKRMQLPLGIAMTNTLSENIFTMMICALNYIPLFVVGKPGCSKTLSVQLLRSNLRGDDSRDEFFKKLPCLFCVTFLGTKSSTSKSIEKVFKKAMQYQEQHGNVQALLILDEIGQAEGSDYNPLKVLHSLLEGKGVHADVAVIGISNWELDAAKMNRAIHLARPDLDETELAHIGSSIYNSITSENMNLHIDPPKWIQKLVIAYKEYTMHQKCNYFHGLRDFYYLIQHISQRVGRKLRNCDKEIIVEGVLRNFSGLLPMDSTAFSYFQRHIDLQLNERKESVIPRIRANIEDKKSRHLMLISNGDASLAAVTKVLEEMNRTYKTLFGSTLPSDQSKEYDHRILSQIILCMEHGKIVVLKNLQNIYGNLYDMLNQSYCVVGGKRHCRVALSADYFPMCCVHDDFRCIIIIDRKDLSKTDVPLLNRFEKQNISLQEHLTTTNQRALCMLEEKLTMMLEIDGNTKIDQRRLMPIQGKDSLSSLISYATDNYPDFTNPIQIWSMCIDAHLPELFNPEIITILKKSKLGKEEQPLVYKMQKTFWKKPIHEGLNHFLKSSTYTNTPFLVLTHSTVNIHIKKCFPNENIKLESMSSVGSEKMLRKTLQSFEKGILMIQFPPEVTAENVTFVKTMVETENRKKETDRKIVLLVHIDRRGDQRFLNRIEFSAKWKIVTLDCILPHFRPLSEIVGKSIVQVLENKDGYFLTKDTLYWAFSRIRYVTGDEGNESGRGIDRIQTILDKLEIVRNHLWKCIITWLHANGTRKNDHICVDQWLYELAESLCLNPSGGSFIGMIEKYLMDCIRNPLAVLVYQLEKNNALQYLMKIDGADANSKMDLWCVLLDQENLLQENMYIKPSGPGCFKIQHENTDYKVPFGKCIIEKVECFKEEFLARLEFLDAEPRITSQFELVSKLRKEIDEFEKLQYDGFEEDYLCDFKTYVSIGALSSLPLETRMNIISWVKDIFTIEKPRNTLEIIANLHTTFWMHSATINGLLRLLQLTNIVGLGDIQHIIDDVDQSFDDISSNNDEDYPKLISLTENLCRAIYPSSRGRGLIDDDLSSWQQTAYALQFVSEKMSDEP